MCVCTCVGYVPLPATKIDFSSDLERPDPNHKKKKKVEKETEKGGEGGGRGERERERERERGQTDTERGERERDREREGGGKHTHVPTLSISDYTSCFKNLIKATTLFIILQEPPPIDAWTVCTKCETYRPPRSHHCK